MANEWTTAQELHSTCATLSAANYVYLGYLRPDFTCWRFVVWRTTKVVALTDSERPHCRCQLPNKVGSIDQMPDIPYMLQWDGRCIENRPFQRQSGPASNGMVLGLTQVHTRNGTSIATDRHAHTDHRMTVVGRSEEIRWGRRENGKFGAKVQRNLGLDFVTKQHKSLHKLQPVYSLM